MLAFSLLVAFSTSAAAALCLQMSHGPGETMSVVVDAAPVAEDAKASPVEVSANTVRSPSTVPCCQQRADASEATAPAHRAVLGDNPANFSAPASQLPVAALMPPARPDPTLEKLDHLTPSLTALSISRT